MIFRISDTLLSCRIYAQLFRKFPIKLKIMVKLRLKRFGKKQEASYRIVATQSTTRRDGRPLEELGFYNPRTQETRLDVESLVRRLKQGAQPTDTVRRILEKAQIFELAKQPQTTAS